MLDIHQARRIAADHVRQCAPPAPNCRVILGNCCPIARGWYFDYAVECDVSAGDVQLETRDVIGCMIDGESGRLTVLKYHQLPGIGLGPVPFHSEVGSIGALEPRTLPHAHDAGIIQYMPYRSAAHHEMHNDLARGSTPSCTFQINNENFRFLVVASHGYGQLAIRDLRKS